MDGDALGQFFCDPSTGGDNMVEYEKRVVHARFPFGPMKNGKYDSDSYVKKKTDISVSLSFVFVPSKIPLSHLGRHIATCHSMIWCEPARQPIFADRASNEYGRMLVRCRPDLFRKCALFLNMDPEKAFKFDVVSATCPFLSDKIYSTMFTASWKASGTLLGVRFGP